MKRVKKVTGGVLLALIVTMGAGQALAGPAESPGITVTGVAESPGFIDATILFMATLIM